MSRWKQWLRWGVLGVCLAVPARAQICSGQIFLPSAYQLISDHEAIVGSLEGTRDAMVHRLRTYQTGELRIDVSTIEFRPGLLREPIYDQSRFDAAWEAYRAHRHASVGFALETYRDRRHWPESFRKKLLDYADHYAHFSTYITVKAAHPATQEWEIVGTMRLIRAAYYGILPGLGGWYLPQIYIQAPVENYLGITLPWTPVKVGPWHRFEDNPNISTGAGEKIEPGNYAIRRDLNHAVFKEILVQMLRVAFDPQYAEVYSMMKLQMDPKYIDDYNRRGKVFHTYGDSHSLRLYRKLGFLPMTAQMLTHHGHPAPTLPIRRDDLDWWPLVLRTEDIENGVARLEQIRGWSDAEADEFRETLGQIWRHDAWIASQLRP